jgi:hypothetical protein
MNKTNGRLGMKHSSELLFLEGREMMNTKAKIFAERENIKFYDVRARFWAEKALKAQAS